MAFYTSRVDDNGNELERRHSARSMAESTSSTSIINLSSRSCEAKSSVRYVNPAAFIEKTTTDPSDTSSVADDSRPVRALSENQSDIVPPLDLRSEDNYPTTRDYTFSYRKHCEAAKIVLKPDMAYETWLSAKRKLISDEAMRRRKAEEQRRKEQEERKRLADIKFKQWLETKSRSTHPTCEKIKEVPSEVKEKPVKPQISEEEAQARLEEWKRVKQLEEEHRRMLKRQEEERRREMEEQRRQMATEAWERWIAEADKKPKPVPLNRGIFTLRGTVSDIFVNPNEWKNLIEEQSN